MKPTEPNELKLLGRIIGHLDTIIETVKQGDCADSRTWAENIIDEAKDLGYLSPEQHQREVEQIIKAEREKAIGLFQDQIPCMPGLFGHGCDQDNANCDECKYIGYSANSEERVNGHTK